MISDGVFAALDGRFKSIFGADNALASFTALTAELRRGSAPTTAPNPLLRKHTSV